MQKIMIWIIAKNKLIKWIFIIFSIFFVLSVWFANYEDFLENIKKTWIDVDTLLESDEISRYDLTRLLNAVNCKNCIKAPLSMVEKYTKPRWNNFKNEPWKAFSDIWYMWWQYKWETYYYCVAYVWDNIRMRWYPSWISPICDWMFCGNRSTTIWEFLQVVLNIADQYVYYNYLVNWQDIRSWLNMLNPNSYQMNILNKDDINLINKLASENISWSLPTESSMQTYLKYCMFNLDACGMQTFGDITQWYWPIAELNILYDHNIVEHEKFKNWEIHELAWWEYVIKTLYNLFKLIDCEFNHDYDCDTLDNMHDNCPNHYNPHQTDTDDDWIWDVCDDDIDGDGILNPIWIVDDLWNIVISKRKKWTDNCLFIVNSNQLDNNHNWQWDACEDGKNYLWMYIKTDNLISTAPISVNFEAITKWHIKWDIYRNFGDWTTIKWKKVSHEFTKQWLYYITAYAEWINNNATAATTILVWKNAIENYWLQISANKISWNIPTEIKFKANAKWYYDKFERDFGDWKKITRLDTKNIIKIFKNEKSNIVTLKWFKDGNIVAVANIIIWAWNNEIASKLSSNNLNPEKWQPISISTDINWFDKTDIEKVEWNRWNENKETNNLLEIEHTYKSAWPHVIIQKIILKTHQEIQTFITIYVKDKFLESSYWAETSISNLIINNYGDIKLKINQKWYIPQTLLILNRYMDWSIEKSNYDDINTENWPKYFEHKYNKKWSFSPKSSIFVNECISLDTIETIAIANNDLCLDALLNNTLNQYKCDIDWDWIPDICDDDIDWDWIPNLIWIIKFEQENCAINMDNINRDIIEKHNWTCGLDNCPSIENSNQMDLNNDWRWDLCDWLYYDNWNIDWDNQNWNW